MAVRGVLWNPPQGLEVHAGSGEIVSIPYDGGAAALDALEHIVAIKRKTEEPYSPVGWTKCGGCPYNSRCWRLAEEANDLARVAGIDQGLAIALRETDVTTPEELVDRFDEAQLAGFQRPWGQRRQPVGARAGQILTMARALASGEIEILQAPQIPDSSNYVMFDLEGLPPFHDDLDRIYLWGMKVCGDNPSDFLPGVAGFGPNGDREGWLAFLDQAQRIFDRYGDIPFVHWARYERTKLSSYIERYGDKNGIGRRVMSSLLDLLSITQSSVALPLPSYSLKVVEQHIGFERTSDDARGDWAMATFIEATETEDEARRSALMDQILHYNEEDLDATWAVLQWLQSV